MLLKTGLIDVAV